MFVLTGKWCLGSFFSRYRELDGRQLLAPFVVGLFDFVCHGSSLPIALARPFGANASVSAAIRSMEARIAITGLTCSVSLFHSVSLELPSSTLFPRGMVFSVASIPSWRPQRFHE
jgi:hypothetical protein